MKNEYIIAEIELVKFGEVEVITASGDPQPTQPGGGTLPDQPIEEG